MKHTSVIFSLILVCGILLAACAPQPQPQPTEPAAPPPAGQPTTPPQPTETGAPPAPPAAPTAAAGSVQHTTVPGELPEGKGVFVGDQSTVSSLNKARAFAGDRFDSGKFERPYNADTMDTYYPYLDIVSANFYQDPTWVYARITLVSPDASSAFPAKYGVEVDLNLDGHGDLLVLVDHPASADWTTDGVKVLQDANGDVGGLYPMNADSAGKSGDGYETVAFDSGNGKDPDAAWARLDPKDPNSLQLAFKTSFLADHSSYLIGAWAGTDALNPALFDLNDHFTHAEAGDPNAVDYPNVYPIKQLFALDNTCRGAIGFVASGKEPGVCPVQ